MSNILKEKIYVPPSFKIKCIGWKLEIETPSQKFHIRFPIHTKLKYEHNVLYIALKCESSAFSACKMRKLYLFLIGLLFPYITELKFVGIGYKALFEDNKIILKLGHSHSIVLDIPENLRVVFVKYNYLQIYGSNYDEVKKFAYKVRSYRKPEPFKGKGVVCVGETIRRKEGKKKYT